MQISDINNPAERKKLICGTRFCSRSSAASLVDVRRLRWNCDHKSARTAATPSPTRTQRAAEVPQSAQELKGTQLDQLSPINWPGAPPAVPEAKRNIFAYYEKPIPAPKPSVESIPSPTPPPALLLASLSPSSVYARTADFTLEVTGDKFTTDARVTVDGRELPTRFVSPQTTVCHRPAALIANAGARQVISKIC